MSEADHTPDGTSDAWSMFLSELPKALGTALLLYGALGAALPLRLQADKELVLVMVQATLLYAAGSGTLLLLAGMLLVGVYARALARVRGCDVASSTAVLLGFRLGGACGVLLGLVVLRAVMLPMVEPIPTLAPLLDQWRFMFHVFSGAAGGLAGAAIGGVTGLFGAWAAGTVCQPA